MCDYLKYLVAVLTPLFLLGLTGCRETEEGASPEPKGGHKEESLVTEYQTVTQLKDRSVDSPLYEIFKKEDPGEDPEWNTEVMVDEAKGQLKALGKALAAEYQDDELTSALKGLVDPNFGAEALRPELEEEFNDGVITVLRKKPLPSGGTTESLALDILKGTKEWRGSLRAQKSSAEEALRWKIVSVEAAVEADRFRTGVRLEVDGFSPAGDRLSQVVYLSCEWIGVETPQLASWQVERFEETHLRSSEAFGGSLPFPDCTASLMKSSASYAEQLARGSDYWYGNFDVAFGIQQGNQGISICDVNGDGREDLFVCQPTGLLSRLYLQNEDGTLRDFTKESGLSWLDDARSALFIDLDGDGDEDLAWGLGYSLTIHENDGTGRFRLRVEIDLFSWPASIAAADYDNDGDLDLYACGYTPRNDVAPGDVFANPVPYQDANNGARNLFIQNEGGFDFKDVTVASGLSQNNRRFSLAASWEDYDQDGDQDLYVANDFGRNNLYRNDLQSDGSRRFVDQAAEAGVEDVAAGMSVSWGDYNRDGLMDIYVSNMFSSAGGRIAFQGQFQDVADEETRGQLQRHARGNTLYENLGDGTFEDVSVDTKTTMGRWAWASHFVDLNNDAWEDLVVTNGFYTAEDSGDL